jgi:hypothetical protein
MRRRIVRALLGRRQFLPTHVAGSMPLGFGLGFATGHLRREPSKPRCFFALGFGLGFATPAEFRHDFDVLSFLCPRFGPGFATRDPRESGDMLESFYVLGFGLGFATSSVWALRLFWICFYAFGFGLGFATVTEVHMAAGAVPLFLCPRFRAGLCDIAVLWCIIALWALARFYALGFGLGFATTFTNEQGGSAQLFLCPRFRAGLCDPSCGMCGWR